MYTKFTGLYGRQANIHPFSRRGRYSTDTFRAPTGQFNLPRSLHVCPLSAWLIIRGYLKEGSSLFALPGTIRKKKKSSIIADFCSLHPSPYPGGGCCGGYGQCGRPGPYRHSGGHRGRSGCGPRPNHRMGGSAGRTDLYRRLWWPPPSFKISSPSAKAGFTEAPLGRWCT